MANRFNPYEYRQPHDGSSASKNQPRLPGSSYEDPSSDQFKSIDRFDWGLPKPPDDGEPKPPAGGTSVPRKPKPTPKSPSSAKKMTLGSDNYTDFSTTQIRPAKAGTW